MVEYPALTPAEEADAFSSAEPDAFAIVHVANSVKPLDVNFEGSKEKMIENVLSDAPVILVTVPGAVIVARGVSSSAHTGSVKHAAMTAARSLFGKCNLMVKVNVWREERSVFPFEYKVRQWRQPLSLTLRYSIHYA